MSQSHNNHTRQKIVEAASAIFSRKGYSKTRVSDIVDSAGIAQGTFYLYFSSKDECFKSILIDWFDTTLVMATERISDGIPALLDAVITRTVHDRELTGIFHDIVRARGDVLSLYDRFRMQLRAIIREKLMKDGLPLSVAEEKTDLIATQLKKAIDDGLRERLTPEIILKGLLSHVGI